MEFNEPEEYVKVEQSETPMDCTSKVMEDLKTHISHCGHHGLCVCDSTITDGVHFHELVDKLKNLSVHDFLKFILRREQMGIKSNFDVDAMIRTANGITTVLAELDKEPIQTLIADFL